LSFVVKKDVVFVLCLSDVGKNCESVIGGYPQNNSAKCWVRKSFKHEGQYEDHKVLKGQKLAQIYRTGQKNEFKWKR
jgi:hypothetical protein